MKKLSALLATCALVMLGLVAVGSPAQAYPQQGFTVSIVAQTVHSGAVVSAYARSQNPCAWSASFAGQSDAATGKQFHMQFTAPQVHRPTTVPLRVSCVTATPGGGGTSVAVHTQTYHRTINVRVLPATAAAQAGSQASAGGAMPNTGGPNLGLLAAGGVLVLGGGAAITAGMRRRRTTA
jgi:uncharacterized protein (DUF58 family)